MVNEVPTQEKMPNVVSAKPERRSFFTSIYSDVVGIVTTAGAGLLAGYVVLENAFNKNLVQDHEEKLRKPEFKRELKRKHPQSSDYINNAAAAEREFNESRKTLLKEINAKSPLKKWKSLRQTQKIEVGLAMVAVSAATVGLISNFVSNRLSYSKQQEIEDRLKELDAKQQHLL